MATIKTRNATAEEKTKIQKQIEALKRSGKLKKGDKIKIMRDKSDGTFTLIRMRPKKKVRRSGIFV